MDRMVALRGPRDSLVPALRMCLEVEMGVGGSSMTQLTLMLITVMNMVVWGYYVWRWQEEWGSGARAKEGGEGVVVGVVLGEVEWEEGLEVDLVGRRVDQIL